MGTTEFAAGEWCGVELDEPIGKNDGSVNEKRCAFPPSSSLATRMRKRRENKKERMYPLFPKYPSTSLYLDALRSFEAIVKLPGRSPPGP